MEECPFSSLTQLRVKLFIANAWCGPCWTIPWGSGTLQKQMQDKDFVNLGHEIFRLLMGTRLGPSVDQYPWLLIGNPGFNRYLGSKQIPWSPLPFFKKNLLIFIFWLCCVACRILVPQPGIEPRPPAVEVQGPNHWTTREVSPLLLIGTGHMDFTVSQ